MTARTATPRLGHNNPPVDPAPAERTAALDVATEELELFMTAVEQLAKTTEVAFLYLRDEQARGDELELEDFAAAHSSSRCARRPRSWRGGT